MKQKDKMIKMEKILYVDGAKVYGAYSDVKSVTVK